MENQIDILQTSDTKTVAFLLCKDIKILKIIRDDPHRIIFCLPQNREVKTLLQLYWANQAQVNPRDLFDKFDYLLDLIHRDYDV